MEIELERTYLLKYLPEDLSNFPSQVYLDIYLPTNTEHPRLRIRNRGQDFEITKKYPVKDKDSTQQYEFTIKLTETEFNEFESNLLGKRARKRRYFYTYNGIKAEIDVYLDELTGLVLADFEFTDKTTMVEFKMPDFCLIEVSQDKTMARGMLVGKKYENIRPFLDSKGYKSLKGL